MGRDPGGDRLRWFPDRSVPSQRSARAPHATRMDDPHNIRFFFGLIGFLLGFGLGWYCFAEKGRPVPRPSLPPDLLARLPPPPLLYEEVVFRPRRSPPTRVQARLPTGRAPAPSDALRNGTRRPPTLCRICAQPIDGVPHAHD